MKINFDATLHELDGTPIIESMDKKEPMTLARASVMALTGRYQDEQLAGTESFKRYQLAKKVHKGGVVELTAEDISLVKMVMGKAFGPAVIGPCYELLESPVMEDAKA